MCHLFSEAVNFGHHFGLRPIVVVTYRQGDPSADALGVVFYENLISTLDVAYLKAFLLQVLSILFVTP